MGNPYLQVGYREWPWHLAGKAECVEALPAAGSTGLTGSGLYRCAKRHHAGDAFAIVQVRASGAKG